MIKKLLLPVTGMLAYQLSYGQLNFTHVTTGLTTVTFELGKTEVEVGDVDGDGDLDIVTIGDHGSPNINATEGGIMVFKNNGTGTSWSLTKTGNFGYGGVALGDVNNDGKMDIGYGMHHNYSLTDFGNQLLEVALGDGTGSSWTPYDDSLASKKDGQTWGMFGTDFGDVNNDGLLDIASNAFGCCDGIWVYKNDGNGHWTVTDGALGGNSMSFCQLGDFNNDGNIDMITSNQMGLVWSNNGSGFFTSMQSGIPNYFAVYFDIADINNDGGKDIGMVRDDSAFVYCYDKSTNKWKSFSTGLPTSNCNSIALADMDMDGFCDVLIWDKSGTITIYKGNGGLAWSPNGTIATGKPNIAHFNTGDFNNDGYTDIVYMSATTTKNTLGVYLSNPATIATLSIMAQHPKGKECFKPGSVQFVQWLSSVPAGNSATVTIEFSSSGSTGPWTTVATNVPNNGAYQWITPTVSSANCYLKFEIKSGNSTFLDTTNVFGIGNCNFTTSVSDELNIISDAQATPNPFQNILQLNFNLIEEKELTIRMVNTLGEEVALIASGNFLSGYKSFTINTEALSSGVYFCEIICQNKKETIKVVKTE